MALTYNDLYFNMRKQFKENNISSWDLEARLVICSAAEKTKEEFLRDSGLYVSSDFEEKVRSLVERRLQGEPVAYITGEWEFYGLPFEVTKDVLIPRSDTEVLVEAAVKDSISQPRVLDLCCGSGCIGIAFASQVPDARVVLADVSDAAIAVARRNVLRNMVTARVSCVNADALSVPAQLLGRFDMILSNPPYIRTRELPLLDHSVIDYEPVLALDGGEDGLMFYRKIAGLWKDILKENGKIFLECGEDQSDDVAEILLENGFKNIEKIKDTQQIERVIKANI